MKVLILGSQGGLGQAFLEVYKDEQPQGLDRDEIDVADPMQVTRVIQQHRPTLVINCAAFTNVDQSEQDYPLAENINGQAPGYIAQACKSVGAVMVHFSSGMVFAGTSEAGYNEGDPTDPVNAYGRSKLRGEEEVQSNTDSFYIIRSTWLFGKTKSGKKSFIDIMLELARGGPIKAVADEYGSPTFDHDLAQATRALVEEKKPHGIYHLVNSGIASRYDWACEIFRIKNINIDVQKVPASEFPRPAPRPKYEILNNTKFIQLRPWQEALEEFLNQ